MKKAHIKLIITSLLILLFLFLAASGAMMYFGKTGMILGVSRNFLRVAHFRAAVFTCALVAAHFIINSKVYFSGLKSLAESGRKGGKP